MSNDKYSQQVANPPIRWSVFIQLALSVLAAFLLFGAAVVIILVNAIQYFAPGNVNPGFTQATMIATSLAFAGILMLPSAWYSWKSINRPEPEPVQKTERRGYGLILTIVVALLVPGALVLGNWISQNSTLAWLFLPLLNIIATGLPALWLVYIGIRGLSLGSPKRYWGVFASGLVLSPLIILILELIMLAGVGILAILWVVVDPSLSSQLNILVLRLQSSYNNPEAVLRILLPLLVNPGILFILFSFVSVLVPMVEESLKPLGVWFLTGQKLTPTHGFVYGVLSGAGFGLFENLGKTSGGGEAWAILASTLIITLLLHCFTAGLVGWALVSAWSQKRYIRLGISYILAVLVHGLWNGMAVVGAAASFTDFTNISLPTGIQQLGSLSNTGIVVLGTLILVLYIGSNATLRRGQLTNDLLPDQKGASTDYSDTPAQASQASQPAQVAGESEQTPEGGPQDQPQGKITHELHR